MRKSIILLFIGFGVIISCKTKNFKESKAVVVEQKREVNYIPYFLEIHKAKTLYDNGSLILCKNKLDSLFNLYEPKESLFINECSIYCEISDTLNIFDKNKMDKILGILVGQYGKDVFNYEKYGEKWRRIIIKSNLDEKKLRSMYTQFQKNINSGIRDTIGVLFERDQIFRNAKNFNEKKLDSIDKLNEPILINIIKKYGYPKEILVGIKDIKNPARDQRISVLLKHLSPISKKIIQPILLEELKNGDCPPFIYAGFLDHSRVIQQDLSFPYYGTYSNVSINDTAVVNKNRLSIGLPKLKLNR